MGYLYLEHCWRSQDFTLSRKIVEKIFERSGLRQVPVVPVVAYILLPAFLFLCWAVKQVSTLSIVYCCITNKMTRPLMLGILNLYRDKQMYGDGPRKAHPRVRSLLMVRLEEVEILLKEVMSVSKMMTSLMGLSIACHLRAQCNVLINIPPQYYGVTTVWDLRSGLLTWE